MLKVWQLIGMSWFIVASSSVMAMSGEKANGFISIHNNSSSIMKNFKLVKTNGGKKLDVEFTLHAHNHKTISAPRGGKFALTIPVGVICSAYDEANKGKESRLDFTFPNRPFEPEADADIYCKSIQY